MNRIDTRHLLAALLAFAAITIVGLWSWNTLAELFGAPEAQLRHVVATLALVGLCRLLLRRRRRRGTHEPWPGT